VCAAGVAAGQQLKVSVPAPAAAASTVSVPPPPPPVATTSDLSEGAVLTAAPPIITSELAEGAVPAAAPLTTNELAPAEDKSKVQAYPQHACPRLA
jgi:hypothetical protein